MITCHIDPIFFAINESISFKYYCEVIYSKIYEFYNRILELEKITNQNIIKFNFTREFMSICMHHNPFRSPSNKIRFKNFLLIIYKKYLNLNCDERPINEIKTFKIKYENENVPESVMKNWNLFLNQCFNCRNCKENNFDFLTCGDIGSKEVDGYLEFFSKTFIDLIRWLNDKFDKCYFIKPTSLNIDPQLKFKKRYWKHHHKLPQIRKILNLISQSEYVLELRPIKLTRSLNQTKILSYNSNSIIISISKKDGVEIFQIFTTAISEKQNEFIIKKFKEKIPEFE